jgi:hypothetical protein
MRVRSRTARWAHFAARPPPSFSSFGVRVALETLAAVSSALSQIFDPDLSRQYNRLAVAAALIPAERGRGKNAAWDVEFSGAQAGAVAEGSDVDDSEYSTDQPVPAALGWAIYRQSFKLSETEIDAAASSLGTPEVLLDMFGERVLNAHHKLVSTINVDIFTGTGVATNGVPNLVGIYGGSLEPTGLYAGISRQQFPEWSGNVLGNGGVARPLTVDLLAQLEQNVFVSCGEPANVIVASAGVVRQYEGFFESIRRVVSDGRGPMDFGAGAANLFYKGMPVIRDRNGPKGRLAMLNTNYLRMKYLPHVNPGDAIGHMEGRLVGSSGGAVTMATDIPSRIVLLAKTGDNVKASVKTTIQLVVKRPNACGYIADIQES